MGMYVLRTYSHCGSPSTENAPGGSQSQLLSPGTGDFGECGIINPANTKCWNAAAGAAAASAAAAAAAAAHAHAVVEAHAQAAAPVVTNMFCIIHADSRITFWTLASAYWCKFLDTTIVLIGRVNS